MDLIITIPPEFVEEFQVNKFEDSLERVLFDISAKSISCGRYERETINMLKEALKESKLYINSSDVIEEFIRKAEEERDNIYNYDVDEYENGMRAGYQYSIEIAETMKGKRNVRN